MYQILTPESSVLFSCPDCDSPVVGVYALPTQNRTIIIVGSCVACDDGVSCYAELKATRKEWRAMLAVPHLPVARKNS